MSGEITVLLIEDDHEEVFLMQELLSHTRYHDIAFKLEHADLLAKGIERIRHRNIDLIVLDLNLPDSQGLETFRRLKEAAPQIPIVILTVFFDDSLALDAMREGAQDYLFKGETDVNVLARTIRYAIERHRIVGELSKVTSELKAANQNLNRLVSLDPLTELLNRRGLQEVLSREIYWLKRDESSLSALLLDIDNFKQINDSLGHMVGDIVLKELSQKLSHALRSTDYISRIGGDEFLILLPKTKLVEAVQVAEKIRLAVSESPISLVSYDPIQLTISLGAASVNENIYSIEELLSEMHMFLHESKTNGKNKVSYQGHYKQTHSPLSQVYEAFHEPSNFMSVKQPIYELEHRRMVGYEFLSRSSINGFEMPDDFFRASSEGNLLTLVDHFCLKNSVKAAALLPAALKRHLNIFPSTLIGMPMEHFLELFTIDQNRSEYCIEISEQQILGDPSYLIKSISVLREAGFLIAVDDVGFGRSCLESLILLKPDIIKIDKKWVHRIAGDLARKESVKRLIKMADSLEAEVVAEGIEMEEDLEELLVLGLKYGQGFLLGRPA